jgi:hypothetical protein
MSVSTYVCVGWYVECANNPKEVTDYRKYCTTDECVHKGVICDKNALFCQYCGRLLSTFRYLTPGTSVDPYYVIDELSESFAHLDVYNGDKIHYWVKNIDSEGVNVYLDNNEICEFPTNLISRDEFKSRYSKELDIFKRNYGDDNVKIKFGVIRYCS